MSDREELTRDVAEIIAECERWKRAHTMACQNITQLNDEKQDLTRALEQSMLMIDKLLTEMRLANVTPSAGLIVTKAAFDQAMRKVLGSQDEQSPVPSP